MGRRHFLWLEGHSQQSFFHRVLSLWVRRPSLPLLPWVPPFLLAQLGLQEMLGIIVGSCVAVALGCWLVDPDCIRTRKARRRLRGLRKAKAFQAPIHLHEVLKTLQKKELEHIEVGRMWEASIVRDSIEKIERRIRDEAKK